MTTVQRIDIEEGQREFDVDVDGMVIEVRFPLDVPVTPALYRHAELEAESIARSVRPAAQSVVKTPVAVRES